MSLREHVLPTHWATFDDTKLTDLLKWASGGFVLLTGVLTFFGIKEGALDRLVRASPVETMAIFLFIGAGVLLALVTPALKEVKEGETTAPVALVLLVVGLLVLLSGVVVGPDLADDRLAESLTMAGVVLAVLFMALVIYCAARKSTMDWRVAGAVVALASVSCGLYNAAKLSVLDKVDIVGAAVTANMTEQDGRRTLTVNVSGEDVTRPIRLQVEGLGPGRHLVLSEHVLTPDRTDALKADLTLPVSGSLWSEVRVVACQDQPTRPTDAAVPCEPTAVYAMFPIHHDPAVVGATLALDPKAMSVSYAVKASSLPSTTYLEMAVGPNRIPVVSGRQAPAVDGTLDWGGSSSVKSQQTWTVTVRQCSTVATPAKCGATTTLATLRVQ